MSFADLAQITVHGTVLDFDGAPMTGSIDFIPTAILAGADDTVLFPAAVVFTADLDGAGHFEILVPATDDPDFTPTGWTYRVTERWLGGRVYFISVPFNSAGGRLELPQPAVSSAGMVSYATQSDVTAAIAAQHTSDTATVTAAIAAQHTSDTATYAPLARRATLTSVGDSIIDNSGSCGLADQPSTPNTLSARGPINCANALLGNRYRLIHPPATGPGSVADNANGYSFCKGGLTVQALLDQGYFSAAGASTAAVVVVEGGTNDINAGTAGADLAALLVTGWRVLTAAGKAVVATTIMPRDSTTFTGPKLIAWQQANRGIRAFAAAEPGVVLCDWVAPLLDPNGATPSGSSASLYTIDGLHPNPLGGWRVAPILATVLDRLVPVGQSTDSLPVSLTDTLTPNPFAAGGTTTATSWTLGTAGSPSTLAASKVARTDPVGGTWQQVACTAATATSDGWTLNLSNANVGTNWNVGDVVFAACEVQADAASWDCRHLQLDVTFSGSSDTASANYESSSERITYCTSTLLPAPIGGLVLVTPRIQIPTGTTTVRGVLRFYGSGTTRVSRFGVTKVQAGT